jgi:hypothetical protein
VCASCSRSKQLTDPSRTLEECQILVCLHEMDLEVWAPILVEELEHGLHPTNEHGLSAELEKALARAWTGSTVSMSLRPSNYHSGS